jgi:hypothetical protein
VTTVIARETVAPDYAAFDAHVVIEGERVAVGV